MHNDSPCLKWLPNSTQREGHWKVQLRRDTSPGVLLNQALRNGRNMMCKSARSRLSSQTEWPYKKQNNYKDHQKKKSFTLKALGDWASTVALVLHQLCLCGRVMKKKATAEEKSYEISTRVCQTTYRKLHNLCFLLVGIDFLFATSS